MNILAINPGHNGSAALLVDGELKFYIEEERLSRAKYDGNPYLGILEALKYGVDLLVLGGTHLSFHSYLGQVKILTLLWFVNTIQK